MKDYLDLMLTDFQGFRLPCTIVKEGCCRYFKFSCQALEVADIVIKQLTVNDCCGIFANT